MVTRVAGFVSSTGELRRAQKIVVTGGANLDPLYAIRVYQNVVEIPEIDVRQVIGKDLLYLVVDCLALLLVERAAALADQLIGTRGFE